MEGAGNDYIYIDDREGRLRDLTDEEITAVSERRTGVGSDGVVMMRPSETALAKMDMWNADGSRSAMCGNALRCVGLYMSNASGKDEFILESGSGIHRTRILRREGKGAVVEVSVGSPVFSAENIPFFPERFRSSGTQNDAEPLIHLPLPDEFASYGSLHASILSMGNPHCVIFVENAEEFPVEKLGPLLERHPAFPERTNVEFVSVNKDGSFYQRTYERGSGETLACGSGACAVLVAGVMEKRSGEKNSIRLRGGTLSVEWDRKSNVVLLSGPAREVFRGEYYF